jgi:hypothetical protein
MSNLVNDLITNHDRNNVVVSDGRFSGLFVSGGKWFRLSRPALLRAFPRRAVS